MKTKRKLYLFDFSEESGCITWFMSISGWLVVSNKSVLSFVNRCTFAESHHRDHFYAYNKKNKNKIFPAVKTIWAIFFCLSFVSRFCVRAKKKNTVGISSGSLCCVWVWLTSHLLQTNIRNKKNTYIRLQPLRYVKRKQKTCNCVVCWLWLSAVYVCVRFECCSGVFVDTRNSTNRCFDKILQVR